MCRCLCAFRRPIQEEWYEVGRIEMYLKSFLQPLGNLQSTSTQSTQDRREIMVINSVSLRDDRVYVHRYTARVAYMVPRMKKTMWPPLLTLCAMGQRYPDGAV